MKSKSIFILICGYKGCGKDFLFNNLKSYESYYTVYASSLEKVELFKTCSQMEVKRVAFADTLKEEFGKMCNLSLKDVDMLKDVAYPGTYSFSIHKPSQPPTYRDCLIEFGLSKRLEDSLYWVKAAASKCVDVTVSIVTDFRFPNELSIADIARVEGSNVVTVRVLRHVASVAPMTDVSEHSLDDYLTDIVLLSMGSSPQTPGKVSESLSSGHYSLVSSCGVCNDVETSSASDCA